MQKPSLAAQVDQINSLPIAVSECIKILLDKGWHDAYELHQRYHLSALEIFNVINLLLRLGVLEKVGARIRLIPLLSNSDVATLNYLRKTHRPARLDIYTPSHLTR